MPTPTSLKNLIDEQITDKTLPYSIDNVDVGQRMKDIVDLTIPLEFNTTSERLAYLLDPDAAPFQEANDKEDGNKYYINKTGTNWVLIASNAPKIEIILFSNQATLTVAWNAERKQKFGDAAQFVIELLGEDEQYRVQYGLEIKPNSISNTTSYAIDLGGGLQSGRLVIK